MIRLTSRAAEDIASLYAFIAFQADEQTASRVLERISETCETVWRFPRIGVRRKDLEPRGNEIRSLTCWSFVIFYTLVDEEPVVVRVIHGSRDIKPGDLTDQL